MKFLISFFILFYCSYVFAKSYECTHELSRFDRPGEYETNIYLRNGNIFVMNDFLEFIIAKDSEEILMLVYLNTDINVFFNTIINKKTKEYTETYTSIEDAKEYENTGLVYGTCEILK